MKLYARALDNITTLRKVEGKDLEEILANAEKIFKGEKFEFVEIPKRAKVSRKETLETFKALTGVDYPYADILL